MYILDNVGAGDIAQLDHRPRGNYNISMQTIANILQH